jgi:hypothetical protein
MVLAIALFVLSAVLIVIFTSVYLWWKKYGKKAYEMMINMKNINQNGKNFPQIGNLEEQMKILKDFFGKKL